MKAEQYFQAPLAPLPFYILLMLNGGECYGHGIASAIRHMSEYHLQPSTGALYPMLKRLVDAELIEFGMVSGSERSEALRQHYAITPLGTILVKEELRRMRHAVEIGKGQDAFIDELPLDIQRMIAEWKA